MTPTARSESLTSEDSRSARSAALSPLRLWLVASEAWVAPLIAPVQTASGLAGMVELLQANALGGQFGKAWLSRMGTRIESSSVMLGRRAPLPNASHSRTASA